MGVINLIFLMYMPIKIPIPQEMRQKQDLMFSLLKWKSCGMMPKLR